MNPLHNFLFAVRSEPAIHRKLARQGKKKDIRGRRNIFVSITAGPEKAELCSRASYAT